MIYFTSTLLNIIVYLVTFAVMWHVFQKREKDIEWEYQAAFTRVCSTFVYTMQTVTQALQAQQAEDETEEDGAPALDPEDDEPYPEIQMVRADEI